MTQHEQAYLNGFCKAAAAYGYEPEALLNKEAGLGAALGAALGSALKKVKNSFGHLKKSLKRSGSMMGFLKSDPKKLTIDLPERLSRAKPGLMTKELAKSLHRRELQRAALFARAQAKIPGITGLAGLGAGGLAGYAIGRSKDDK